MIEYTNLTRRIRMRLKLFKLVILVVLLFVVCSASAFAYSEDDESAFTWGFEGGFVSKYVFRGILSTDGICFQPDFWIGTGPFTFDIWGNMDMDDANEAGWEFSEVDFTLSYDHSFPLVDVTAGATYYMFPAIDADETTEVFAGAAFIDFPFTPSLTVYYDVQDAEGMYFDLGFGGTVGGTNDVTGMDWDAHLGYGTSEYNDYYFGAGDSSIGPGFNDFSLEISRTFAMKGFYIKPMAGCSFIIDDDIRDLVADPDNYWFGIFAGIEI